MAKREACIHQKIARSRKDHGYKTSHALVRTGKKVFFCEDLNLKGLSKRNKAKQDEKGNYLPNGQKAKSGLNKSWTDAGFGQFFSTLEYIAEKAGARVIKVKPAYTSQLLSYRDEFIFTDCGIREYWDEKELLNLDRDINASINVKRVGLGLFPTISATRSVETERRMTGSQDNQGKKTAGVDGVKSLTQKQRITMVNNLKIGCKSKPTRRIWIPKPGKEEKRPLGIPTMKDRATQALVKLAIEPEWEAHFEPNSYGFRPGRSCQDAVKAIFQAITLKPKYVLDADIAKCFDKINHERLLQKLNTFPKLRKQIRAWLKSSVMDGKELFPTSEGTPPCWLILPYMEWKNESRKLLKVSI